MAVRIVIKIGSAVVDKNKRILWCVLFVKGLYVILIYLGMKLGYTGDLIFFGLVIALAFRIYVYRMLVEIGVKN